VFSTLELEKVCSVRIVGKQLLRDTPAVPLNDTVSAAVVCNAKCRSDKETTDMEDNVTSLIGSVISLGIAVIVLLLVVLSSSISFSP